MFSNNSPFSFLTNSDNSNNNSNNKFFFNNQNQSKQRNSQNRQLPDFLPQDGGDNNRNYNRNYQSRTKQRCSFYGNDQDNPFKQCLDYFLNKGATFNLICFQGNNNQSNYDNNNQFKNNNNNNDNPFNFSREDKNNNIMDIKLNDSVKNNESIHPKLSLNSFNNNIEKNDKLGDSNDFSCPPPPIKESNNSCFSRSTFNSSFNSNNNNYNSYNDNSSNNIDSLIKDFGNMKINEGQRNGSRLSKAKILDNFYH